jgi:heme a synthase
MSYNKKSIWIIVSIMLVYSMIILGGYTRLTHSGLSIVQWDLVSGIIPPLNQLQWEEQFLLYKTSPEYKKINYLITISEFKEIFLIEYLHRLLGRVTGMIFFIPLIYFALTKQISNKEFKYFFTVACLIALQGGIGWFMVKSGLIDDPSVSQYRLALHLFMACIILIMLTFKISNEINFKHKHWMFSMFLLMLQIISGAFVAGLKAGLIYNSFPLMDGQLIPNGLLTITPWYKNIFENIICVQFIHRFLGILNFINISIYSYRCFQSKNNYKIATMLSIIVVIQFILGILTLLLQVPVSLGILHQSFAVILLFILSISSRKRT